MQKHILLQISSHIYFSNDIDMTKRLISQNLLKKWIKIQNQKHLSLKGKTIIINNVTLQTLVCT